MGDQSLNDRLVIYIERDVLRTFNNVVILTYFQLIKKFFLTYFNKLIIDYFLCKSYCHDYF
jgi:hypothetical protein